MSNDPENTDSSVYSNNWRKHDNILTSYSISNSNNIQNMCVVKLILAQDAGYGIGYKSQLPWKDEPCKEDMELFRTLTTGCGSGDNCKNAVIMGYNTWSSIPARFRPLPNRSNIVMTNAHRSETYPDNVEVCSNWDEVKRLLVSSHYDVVWVIGGVEIYRSAIEYDGILIDGVYRTTFKKKYLCDKYIDVEGLLENRGYVVTKKTISETDRYVMELLTTTKPYD